MVSIECWFTLATLEMQSVIVGEFRESVNWYDSNRTHVWVPGGFRECMKIVKMAGDGHANHVRVLLFIFFILRVI